MTALLVLPSRDAVGALRRSLARDRVLYEVSVEDGEADWRPARPDRPFDFAAPPPLTGAKRFFFPPRETLLRWHATGVDVTPPEDIAPFALVGVRPCDLAAIAYQDRFFADDAWYAARRSAAFLVGLDCTHACAGGFCVNVDAGPFARGGYDLDLTPLPDGRVAVQIGSERGRAALASAGVDTLTVDAETDATFTHLRHEAAASFPARPFVGRAIARLDAGTIADDEWQALGPACLACTGCTSLCPTCSCFTVVDEPRGEAGERVRVWDSCLLEGFQREASGHHPAPRPGDRVHRFWHHKLSRDFASLGRLGCVGCGRCDVTCPGSIGALRTLARLGER